MMAAAHDAHIRTWARSGRAARASLDRPAAVYIDLHTVEPKHDKIHARLLNWASWCCGDMGGAASAPGFELYRSSARAREQSSGNPSPDRMDAAMVAKGVYALPAPHRAALNWCYLKPVAPGRACRELGTTMAGLAQLVRDGRTMLVNRGV